MVCPFGSGVVLLMSARGLCSHVISKYEKMALGDWRLNLSALTDIGTIKIVDLITGIREGLCRFYFDSAWLLLLPIHS